MPDIKPITDEASQNTDTELFRERDEKGNSDYYSNSMHVTADGAIGINVGGYVTVLPLAEWYKLANPWQPMETVPYDTNVLFLREDGNVYQDFIYDETVNEYFSGQRLENKVVKWMPVPPTNVSGEQS